MSMVDPVQKVQTSNDTDHNIEGIAPQPEVRLHDGGYQEGPRSKTQRASCMQSMSQIV